MLQYEQKKVYIHIYYSDICVRARVRDAHVRPPYTSYTSFDDFMHANKFGFTPKIIRKKQRTARKISAEIHRRSILSPCHNHLQSRAWETFFFSFL